MPDLLDALLGAALLAWTAAPSGPLALLSVAGCFVLCMADGGRPRLQISPALAAAVAVGATLLGGRLFTPASWPLALLRIAVACALGASALADALIPLTPRWPTERGPAAVASLTVRVGRRSDGTDFMLRVYYPCAASGGTSARVPFVPYLRLGSHTARGFAHFMRLPGFVFDWLRFLPPRTRGGGEDAPLWRPAAAASGDGTAVEPPPLVVFSHGLGGVPDCYTSLISDLASRGHVVLAPEHADESAAFTALSSIDEESSGGGHEDEVPYMHLSAAQAKDMAAAYKRRHGQLKQRVREVGVVLDVAAALCGGGSGGGASAASHTNGGGIYHIADTARSGPLVNGREGAASTGPLVNGKARQRLPRAAASAAPSTTTTATLNGGGDGGLSADLTIRGVSVGVGGSASVLSFADLLSLVGAGTGMAHGAALVGHSFGAATALASAERAPPGRVCAVVALDPWMWPLSPHTLRRGLADTPVLSLCGDGFTAWKENHAALRLLLCPVSREGAAALRGQTTFTSAAAVEGEGAVFMEAAVGASKGADEGVAKEADGGAVAGVTEAAEPTGNGVAQGGVLHHHVLPAPPPPPESQQHQQTQHSQQTHHSQQQKPQQSRKQTATMAPPPIPPPLHVRLPPRRLVHPGSALLTLKGAQHQNFNDFALVATFPLRRLMMLGRGLNPVAGIAAVRELTAGFIDASVAAAAAATAVVTAEAGGVQRSRDGSHGRATSKNSSTTAAPDSTSSSSASGGGGGGSAAEQEGGGGARVTAAAWVLAAVAAAERECGAGAAVVEVWDTAAMPLMLAAKPTTPMSPSTAQASGTASAVEGVKRP